MTPSQFRGVCEVKQLELGASYRLSHDGTIVFAPVRRRAGKIELQFAATGH